MRIAVPLYREEVAPRFCSADRLLVVDVKDGVIAETQVLGVGFGDLPRRLVTLSELGVERLLCGGFNRRFLPMAERLGIEVTWGLYGKADAAIQAVLEGRPLPRMGRGGGGGGRRRRHRRGGPRRTQTNSGGRNAWIRWNRTGG